MTKINFSNASELIKWALAEIISGFDDEWFHSHEPGDLFDVTLTMEGREIDFVQFLESYHEATQLKAREVSQEAVLEAHTPLMNIINVIVNHAHEELEQYLRDHPDSLDMWRNGDREYLDNWS